MSDELQKPPVIDLEALLQPIPGDNPAGENLRYSGIYDEIAEARRADDTLNQGAWQSEVKLSDFRRVIELAVPTLNTRAKDLQIGAWLTEALIKEHGFAGLRDSLRLLGGLQENYWETLHPEIDEGDQEGRANAISWLDTQASLAIKGAPITAGEGYSFIDWEDSKLFEFPDNIDTLDLAEQQRYNDLKTQAENERRVTGDMWRRAKMATNRLFCEQTNYLLDECWTAFADINRVIEEKYDRNQMPGLSNLKKSLDQIHTQVKKLLDEKREEEPDEIAETGASGDETGVMGATAGAGTGPGGPIQSRREALKRLSEIAEFFQKTEPHSPVSYLVQRAVKWGNMPLDSWLQDVIKDDTVLYQLRQTLGFNTGAAETQE
jgi:type VI secretion system protein ImpA